MTYTIAITFNDFPNVIHIMPFEHRGATVVELKIPVKHPRTGLPTMVYYRNTSLRGKKIYRYSEGQPAGEALGG